MLLGWHKKYIRYWILALNIGIKYYWYWGMIITHTHTRNQVKNQQGSADTLIYLYSAPPTSLILVQIYSQLLWFHWLCAIFPTRTLKKSKNIKWRLLSNFRYFGYAVTYLFIIYRFLGITRRTQFFKSPVLCIVDKTCKQMLPHTECILTRIFIIKVTCPNLKMARYNYLPSTMNLKTLTHFLFVKLRWNLKVSYINISTPSVAMLNR